MTNKNELATHTEVDAAKGDYSGEYLFGETNHCPAFKRVALVVRNPDESSPLFGLEIMGTQYRGGGGPGEPRVTISSIPRDGRSGELEASQIPLFGDPNGGTGSWKNIEQFIKEKSGVQHAPWAKNLFPRKSIKAPEYSLEQVMDILRTSDFISKDQGVRDAVCDVLERCLAGKGSYIGSDQELTQLATQLKLEDKSQDGPKSPLDHARRDDTAKKHGIG